MRVVKHSFKIVSEKKLHQMPFNKHTAIELNSTTAYITKWATTVIMMVTMGIQVKHNRTRAVYIQLLYIYLSNVTIRAQEIG